MTAFPKPSRTARIKSQRVNQRSLKTEEALQKRLAKKRDGHACRFPMCGCRALKLDIKARLESSHHRHKGMGGDPTGERSLWEWLPTLCLHRHQTGAISRHAGTLRPLFLTDFHYSGAIAWEIDVAPLWQKALKVPALAAMLHQAKVPGNGWYEVGREVAVQQWRAFTLEQLAVLRYLADMEV